MNLISPVSPNFTKLCKKLDDFMLEATIEELNILYYMIHTEIMEREDFEGKVNRE